MNSIKFNSEAEQSFEVKDYSSSTSDFDTNMQSGVPGKDGKSVYEIWLEQGNTGTVDDFLESMKG